MLLVREDDEARGLQWGNRTMFFRVVIENQRFS